MLHIETLKSMAAAVLLIVPWGRQQHLLWLLGMHMRDLPGGPVVQTACEDWFDPQLGELRSLMPHSKAKKK